MLPLDSRSTKHILDGVLNSIMLFLLHLSRSILVTLNTCQYADWRACTALYLQTCIAGISPGSMRLRRQTAWKITRAWGARASFHASGTAILPRPNAWLVMKSVPNPARTPVAGSADRGDLGKYDLPTTPSDLAHLYTTQCVMS